MSNQIFDRDDDCDRVPDWQQREEFEARQKAEADRLALWAYRVIGRAYEKNGSTSAITPTVEEYAIEKAERLVAADPSLGVGL